MPVIDTCALLHAPMVEYWKGEAEEYRRTCKYKISNRFERAEGLGAQRKTNGDELVEKVQDIFMNGFGIEWSPIQIRIFNALVDSILPRIYGKEWDEVKSRVMAERGMDRLYQETLVNMARRNGKTWVVSGAAAAVFLVVPGVTLAVFSVGKRQATMFMNSVVEKMERAFKRGTHVKQSDYNLLKKNQEELVYEHPSGAKQILGCYPGSAKVRKTPSPKTPLFFESDLVSKPCFAFPLWRSPRHPNEMSNSLREISLPKRIRPD